MWCQVPTVWQPPMGVLVRALQPSVLHPSIPGANSVVITAGHDGEDVTVVRAAFPWAPGAAFAEADSDALNSDTHHVAVTAATALIIEGDNGGLAAVGGYGGNCRALPIDVFEEAHESAVNRSLVSLHPPS